jgi:hypothetical protein
LLEAVPAPERTVEVGRRMTLDFSAFFREDAMEPGCGGGSAVQPKPQRRTGVRVARDIDRKLRLTAALLGAVTRKDLAAAFRRANPATPFDVDRAHKWLQGRARPREPQLYEDWAKLLDLGQPGQWIAECDSEAFLDAICTRHQRDRDALRRQIGGPAAPAGPQQERGPALAGTYACYSHAWSPYFRGRVIRGELSITAATAGQRLSVTAAEALPTGRLQLDGFATLDKRALHIDVREAAGQLEFAFCLFRPAPPVSLLAGFMCGATVIGPEVQLSVTRIAMVRLPGASPKLRQTDAYLAPQASVARDLATLGMPVAEPALVDQHLTAFLSGGEGGGVDQIASAAYLALAELLDRSWLAFMTTVVDPAPVTRGSPVSLAERRAQRR